MDFFSFSGVKKMDGRWLVVGCILVYFAILFAAGQFVDYHKAWRRLGVPSMAPSFLDTRVITSAWESARDGFDPMINNPHDPLGRPMNYPRLWLYLGEAMNLHQNITVTLGVSLALTFYACALLFMARLEMREGIVWGGFLCAPPTMLAIERGNNDLVIFCLIALALIARRSNTPGSAFGGYTLIELAAMLKLYPFVAFTLILREKTRSAIATLIVALSLFIAYLLVIRGQLQAVQKGTPHPFDDAFGSHVFFDRIKFSHPGIFPSFSPLIFVLILLVLGLLGRLLAPRLPAISKPKIEGLIVGGILYVSAFVLNSNFNYRLIFLLFTVPGLLELLKTQGFYRRLAMWLLISLAAGWAFASQTQIALFLVKEMFNWVVFAAMVFLWLECVPLSRWLPHTLIRSLTCLRCNRWNSSRQ